ncbi:hypothetical protein AB4156_34145 [Cupriavidus sp. 2MCAB6]|uniref:hypothetical protein n=1 Tax=Cupriavidus sp. 2MCAB6 TaxID=3232981 RepID=UPI003F8F8C9D
MPFLCMPRIAAGTKRYYLAVLQRKPRALRNGAPFGELPEGFIEWLQPTPIILL